MNWKNHFNHRTDFGYDHFRESVLRRDGYRCQMPGCDSRHRLEVHHIEKYAKNAHQRTDVSNGITLCRSCHYYVRGKEKHYIALFNEIVYHNDNRTR